jgi:Protein of unknown function with HXXEE motif
MLPRLRSAPRCRQGQLASFVRQSHQNNLPVQIPFDSAKRADRLVQLPGAIRMTMLWWAPLAASILHIIEEFLYPGGFAEWDRSYRPMIKGSITTRLHIILNGALLFVCIQVGLLASSTDMEAQTVGVAGWLILAALLSSNAVFHIVGTIRTATYSPGVVSAVTLYLPLTAIGYWWFIHHGKASVLTATAAAMVGGSYHSWAALIHRIRSRNNSD